MPPANVIRDAVTRYLEAVAAGSADDIASCYAQEATLEDPAGSEPRRGRAAIKEFYTPLEGLTRHTELLTLRIAGDRAAFCFRVRTVLPGRCVEVEPIDVMSFDDAGQITGMRAFWSNEDVRLTTPGQSPG